MARVYVSAVMDIPLASAWKVLRDFNGLPSYHPFFKESHIEDGLPADRIGCVRNFRGKEDDALIRERLLTLSDHEHACCYCILEAPLLPVRNYIAEVRLKPITETDQTFGEWWATFEAAPADEASCIGRVTDTFRLAFQGVEALVKRQR